MNNTKLIDNIMIAIYNTDYESNIDKKSIRDILEKIMMNKNPVIIDWDILQKEANKYKDWGDIKTDHKVIIANHNIIILNDRMNIAGPCDMPVWRANIKEKTLTYIDTDGQAYI